MSFRVSLHDSNDCILYKKPKTRNSSNDLNNKISPLMNCLFDNSKINPNYSFIIDATVKENYAIALMFVNKCIQNFPKDSNYLFLRANILKKQGDYTNALADVDQALLNSPSNANFLYEKAHLHYLLNDHSQAKVILKTLVDKKQADEKTWDLFLKILSGKASFYDEFFMYLKIYSSLFPISNWSLLSKSKFEYDAKNFSAAFENLNNFAFSNSHNICELKLRIKTLKKLKKYDEAVKFAIKVNRIESSHKSLFEIGKLYFKLSDYNSALIYFEKAFDINKKTSNLLLKLSIKSFIYLNKYEEALNGLITYEKNFNISSFDAEFLKDCSEIFFNLKRFDESLDYIFLAYCIDPNNSLMSLQNIIEKILSNDPDHINSLYFKGWLFLQINQYNEALEVFDSILKSNPNHLPSLLNRNFCLNLIGKKDDALNGFKQIIDKQSGVSVGQEIKLSSDGRFLFRPFLYDDLLFLIKNYSDFYFHSITYFITFKNLLLMAKENSLGTLSNAAEEIYIAQDLNSVNGKGFIFYYYKKHTSMVCCIHLLLVDENIQKNGVGGVLLRHSIDQAKAKNCSKVKLTSTLEGLNLYLKNNFILRDKDFESDEDKKAWEQLSINDKKKYCNDSDKSKLIYPLEVQSQTE